MPSTNLILEIQTGKYKGRRIRVAAPQFIIGRGESAGLKIASAEVSREHCVLIPQENGVLVRDMESRNGTFIDGRPIMGEKLLTPGSTLTIGPLTFQLLGGRPATSSGQPVEVLGKAGAEQQLSDDDIASLLSDELPAGSDSSDTAVVKARGSGPANPLRAESVTPAPAPRRRREFASLEEEARDIIRRHFESLGQDSGDSAS